MDDSDGVYFGSLFLNHYFRTKYTSWSVYLHDFLILMIFLSRLWKAWKRFGFFIGNIVSNVFLTIFYFTIFALFAIPYKITVYYKKSSGSNFKLPGKQMCTLEDFQKEF